ncbi:uncharacterized protein LOC131840846 [Achroia grisella]|uniref:uncharacterized protein LOC131840846 n=1 Tax=Achroia grisella TaxID=688607 RepID=UPI0027D285C0|nr:uncharacterized protein LOC131840846 [Achroia grisella]
MEPSSEDKNNSLDKSSDEEIDEVFLEAKKINRRPNVSVAWEYFEIEDSKRHIATCKLCGGSLSYMSSVTNLMKHVRRKHPIAIQPEEESESDNDVSRSAANSISTSTIWTYFKSTDRVKKVAICLICKKRLSYHTSMTNLKRHLGRAHPNIDLSEKKKVIISRNGQLYEIEETKDGEDVDDEQTNIEDSVFLNEYDDNITKDNKERIRRELSTKARERVVPLSDSSKKERKRIYVDENNSNKSNSSNERYRKRHFRTRDNDSLEHFARYLISLMKQLPREVSSQLQADFVKQIIDAQLTSDTQTRNGYKITVVEQPHKTEQACQEYVTVEGAVIETVEISTYIPRNANSLMSVLFHAGEESDNSSKQDDLNSYFELQTGGRVRCVLCHSSVPQREEAQRAHMQEKHQKLVRDQDQEQEEDRMPFHSDDENEQDIFSNVIYVDEQRQAEKSPPKKNSSKPLKKFTSQKRRERDSTSSEEVVIRKKKLKIDNDDELEGFLRYIGCLLKKLPNEKFMQLQMEIVNLIMKTSMLNQNDTSVTVPVPSTSYYVTMPDKVLQSDTSLGTVTQANISTDLCGNPSTIIINSVKETDGNEKQL